MSRRELNALLWSLDEEELAEILNDEELRELVMRDADINTLRHLRTVYPTLVEPEFDDVEGDDANEDSDPSDDLRFKAVRGARLYGDDGEIGMDDINQGELGDCWWLAGLGAVSEKHPELIKDMIEDNGNGTYTLTFPGTGEEATVTSDILFDDEDSPAFSTPQDGFMWPAILEKAYAEREGGFGEVEGGCATVAMEIVTGEDSKTYDDVEDISESDLAGLVNGGQTAVTVSTMQEDNADGDLYDKDTSEGGLATGHAYIVREVNDDEVELHNPWSYDHVTLSMADFHEHVRRVAINSYDGGE